MTVDCGLACPVKVVQVHESSQWRGHGSVEKWEILRMCEYARLGSVSCPRGLGCRAETTRRWRAGWRAGRRRRSVTRSFNFEKFRKRSGASRRTAPTAPTASAAHLFFHIARRKTMALSKTQLYCRSLPRAVDSKVSANHLSACLYMLMPLFVRIPSTATAECTRDIR